MNQALGMFLVVVSIVTCPSCKKGKHNDEACNGDTRREVKLLVDGRAPLVDTVSIFITIDSLGALEVPEVHSETGRQDMELFTYTVRCIVEEEDRKRDGDYHLLLKDGDKYIIAEVPNPNCEYASASSYKDFFQEVYDFVEANDLDRKEVEITGVAFVDIDHHYSRKQADNNLELHPIVRIRF